MRAAVIVFPGSNCDRDIAVALERVAGRPADRVWHRDASLPDGLDLVALPGGFSFGDYLRCGAVAARSPAMSAVRRFASAGGLVLGVCNGFQILVEAGLLPGAFLRNSGLRFVCRDAGLRVETTESPFTRNYRSGECVRIPVAHAEGGYHATPEILRELDGEARIAFRYADLPGATGNPNGSVEDIAGILSANRRILGMMPHPERAADPVLGGTGGARLFEGLVQFSAGQA